MPRSTLHNILCYVYLKLFNIAKKNKQNHGLNNQWPPQPKQPISITPNSGNYKLALTDSFGYTTVRTIQVDGTQSISATFNVSNDTVQMQQSVALVSTSQAAFSKLTLKLSFFEPRIPQQTYPFLLAIALIQCLLN